MEAEVEKEVAAVMKEEGVSEADAAAEIQAKFA
eukprot:SAG11_NODE_10519_length_825_cov_0.966942_2_plen_32_part_01